jgi:hypothetical protein
VSFANGNRGCISVDLDGTLAHYDGWKAGHIGEPIPLMVERVKRWLAEGKEVRIVTARVTGGLDPVDEAGARASRRAIEIWCISHIGQILMVTNAKDYAMVELWDDRCVQVIPNTGRTISEELESVKAALAGNAVGPHGEEVP